MSRPDWDQYFMRIASVVATRSTCDRKNVGAVIVRERTILSTGYNGAPRGVQDCSQVGHLMVDLNGRQSCVRTVHAEANAILQAAREGIRVEGGTLYTTASSCWDCAMAIINAGIKRVVAAEFYSSRYGQSADVGTMFAMADIEAKLLVP